MKFLVIFDRDGTLIVDKNYLSDPQQVEILPGVIEGLQKLAANGAVFALASNQSGIGRGLFSHEAAHVVNDRLVSVLQNSGLDLPYIYFCPHTPVDKCRCRKPQPEMLLRALQDSLIDKKWAFMVGDKIADVLAGRNAGMRSILLRTGYGAEIDTADCQADFIAEDLQSAADWMIMKIKNPG